MTALPHKCIPDDQAWERSIWTEAISQWLLKFQLDLKGTATTDNVGTGIILARRPTPAWDKTGSDARVILAALKTIANGSEDAWFKAQDELSLQRLRDTASPLCT